MYQNIRYSFIKALESNFRDDTPPRIRETLKTKGLAGQEEPFKGFFGEERFFLKMENGLSHA